MIGEQFNFETISFDHSAAPPIITTFTESRHFEEYTDTRRVQVREQNAAFGDIDLHVLFRETSNVSWEDDVLYLNSSETHITVTQDGQVTQDLVETVIPAEAFPIDQGKDDTCAGTGFLRKPIELATIANYTIPASRATTEEKSTTLPTVKVLRGFERITGRGSEIDIWEVIVQTAESLNVLRIDTGTGVPIYDAGYIQNPPNIEDVATPEADIDLIGLDDIELVERENFITLILQNLNDTN